MISSLALALVHHTSRSVSSSVTAGDMPHTNSPAQPGTNTSTIEVYFGNGCYWERQWAYYVVETDATGPFARQPNAFTAKVGYGGGSAPPEGDAVCYHSGDGRDYSALGHAEVNRISLDSDKASTQLRALAVDFFASFLGPHGGRIRPDPMDAGSPYRSVIGLPGGTASPLYEVITAANTFGMALKPATAGGGADEVNTVWVYSSETFPFWDGEVYHQCHCDFRMTAGMPYPQSYTRDVWNAKKAAGDFVPTGCPEGVMPHPGQMCPSFGR